MKTDKAHDGLLAVDYVKNRHKENPCCKNYDFILMDIEMPNLNGFETTSQIIKFYDELQENEEFR